MKTTKKPFLFRPPEYLLEYSKSEARKNGETISGFISRLIREDYMKKKEVNS